MKTPVAKYLGKIKGKRIHRFPVIVSFNDSQTLSSKKTILFVTSDSAANAANYIRDQIADRPETEITAIGPRGGETHRYVGWYSAIGNSLFEPNKQLRLFD